MQTTMLHGAATSQRLDLHTLSFQDFVPAVLAVILSLTEWVCSIGGHSLVARLIPLTGWQIYALSLVLLALSLVLVASSRGLKAVLHSLAYSLSISARLLSVPQGRKALFNNLPSIVLFMLTVATLIFPLLNPHLQAYPDRAISVAYFLFLAIIMLQRLKIPTAEQPVLSDGIRNLELKSHFRVYDVRSLLSIVRRSDESDWRNGRHPLVVRPGETALLIDPDRLSAMVDIQLTDSGFEMCLPVRVTVRPMAMPDSFNPDAFQSFRNWSNADAAIRTATISLAASTGLAKYAEIAVKSMLGIGESGQLLFDNLATVLKKGGQTSWTQLHELDAQTMADMLAEKLSQMVLGPAFKAGRSLFDIKLSIRNVELKGHFAEINRLIEEVSQTRGTHGQELQADLAKRFVDAYTSSCMVDPEKALGIFSSILFGTGGTTSIPGLETPAKTVEAVEIKSALPEARTRYIADKLEIIGAWLREMPTLNDLVDSGQIWNALYPRLREAEAVGLLRPGINGAALAREITAETGLPASDFIDPDSRLYTDQQYRWKCAEKISSKNSTAIVVA